MTNANGPRRAGAQRALAAGLLAACIAGCAIVPAEQQSFMPGPERTILVRALPCPGKPLPDGDRPAEPLPGPELRVLSWNLHKNGDRGWDVDLARFAATSDLLLLQEAALDAPLARILDGAGFDWLLGSSFALNGREMGVLNAARVRPASACTLRIFEPLLQLPKSAVITRYALSDREGTLAVANVHAINFTLALDDYSDQLDAIARELAQHAGPIVFAGDFNTWSVQRLAIVERVATALGLTAALPPRDTRSRFLGQQVDYVFVRGLAVLHVEAPEVASSDHNPVLVTLRLASPR